jgi:hypothetical protein
LQDLPTIHDCWFIWILIAMQFVTAGPEWVAILLEAVAPPFALFRALWEAAQYAFLAGSVGDSTGKAVQGKAAAQKQQ